MFKKYLTKFIKEMQFMQKHYCNLYISSCLLFNEKYLHELCVTGNLNGN